MCMVERCALPIPRQFGSSKVNGFQSVRYKTLKSLLKLEAGQFSNKHRERKYLLRMTKIKLGKSSDFYLQLHVSRLQ